MIVIVMGVTGSGKTTVGVLLAKRLGWDFLDADDFRIEMKLLAHRGYDLNVIQVLAPEELQKAQAEATQAPSLLPRF